MDTLIIPILSSTTGQKFAFNLYHRVYDQELNKKLEKNMNVCMRATFNCSWDNMVERLEANMASASDAHTSWTIAKESENSLIFMANIIDFDALGDLIMNEDQL